RVVEWALSRKPLAEVAVQIGAKAPPGGQLGADALLDFRVAVTIDGEEIGADELRALLAGGDGLVSLRGRWVELDRGRLKEGVAHWETGQRRATQRGSVPEGVLLLAGARLGGGAGPAEGERPERVLAGAWLAGTLAALRSPEGLAAADPGPALKTTLRPYQAVGVRWLWLATRLGLGVCLAD